MLDSMTREEKRNPDIIDISRRRRIAAGSGTEPLEVKQLLTQYETARTLMRQMAKMSIFERMKMMTGLGKMGAFQPGAKLMKSKVGTGHRKSAKERAEDRKRKRKQDRRGKKK
jgi:signal recognition particle subunit SRP54